MITSRTNPLIKNIRSLKDKKNRDEQNVFVANGVKLVCESLKSGFNVKLIVATESCLAKLPKSDCKIEVVSEDLFSYISTETTPQGVLAIVEKPCEKKAESKKCLLLDEVSDPANVGAIIRTCASANYLDIFMIDSADAFNPKSIRASMGGIFKVRLHNVSRENAKNVINRPFIIADMGGESVFTFKKMEEFCLVIGNEGNGVSDLIKSQADFTVSIPMDNDMESLNASVSAGILMYLLK